MKGRIWSFFSVLYTFYAIVVFLIPFPFILTFHLLISWMDEKPRLRLIYRSHRLWISLWEFLVRVRFEVNGMELLDQDQAYVMVGNHNNMLDVLLVGSYFIHPWMSLVKKEMLKVPGVGYLISRIAILVDRSNPISRKKSMDDMVAHLQRGVSILVFPEGTRNRSQEPLRRFYAGAFKVAIAAQVPVLPFVIYNTRSIQPVNKIRLYPGKGYMRVLPPIPTAGLDEGDTEALKQQIHALIKEKVLEWDESFAQPLPKSSS